MPVRLSSALSGWLASTHLGRQLRQHESSLRSLATARHTDSDKAETAASQLEQPSTTGTLELATLLQVRWLRSPPAGTKILLAPVPSNTPPR